MTVGKLRAAEERKVSPDNEYRCQFVGRFVATGRIIISLLPKFA
jgi:hypothetical protein